MTAHDTAVRSLDGSSRTAVDEPTDRQLALLHSQLEESPRSSTSSSPTERSSASPNSRASRQRMTEAATSVERIIHDDMSWVTERDAHKLLVSLLHDATLRGRIPADAARR